MARARSLNEFQTSFPDETSCVAFLFQRRWPQGFVCPACGGARAALLRSRAQTYECLGCGRQTSITAGTVMYRSKLPLRTAAGNLGLVDLNQTGQRGPAGRDHAPAQLATEQPSTPVRSQAELALQLQGRPVSPC